MRCTIVIPASIPRCAGVTSGMILNVGRGFVSVFRRENLRPFLVGVAATGLSALFDDQVRDEIEKVEHSTNDQELLFQEQADGDNGLGSTGPQELGECCQ